MSSHANAPDRRLAETHRELLESLFRELAQTEKSAESHARREARRLVGAPAAALEAVAAHARRALRDVEGLARAEDLPTHSGRAIGRAFSNVREAIADRLVDRERSYRGTLLGLRHGIDVVTMLRHVADASGRVEIAGFCTRWLDERTPLVEAVARELSWFARHPTAAVQSLAMPDFLRRRRHRLAQAPAS
jgi:hypothetical protein